MFLNDRCHGDTKAMLTSCIFQCSVDSPPVESAESSRQMPVANRVVPVQADQCHDVLMRRDGTKAALAFVSAMLLLSIRCSAARFCALTRSGRLLASAAGADPGRAG